MYLSREWISSAGNPSPQPCPQPSGAAHGSVPRSAHGVRSKALGQYGAGPAYDVLALRVAADAPSVPDIAQHTLQQYDTSQTYAASVPDIVQPYARSVPGEW
eukprot:355064-Rhodomonas_salina.2